MVGCLCLYYGGMSRVLGISRIPVYVLGWGIDAGIMVGYQCGYNNRESVYVLGWDIDASIMVGYQCVYKVGISMRVLWKGISVCIGLGYRCGQ